MPTRPPFRVGERVKYLGPTSFRYGDNPMVDPGDIGRVVENHPAMAATGILLDYGDGRMVADKGLDGWSVVEIKGNRMAIGADSTDRYVRART
jgi:hypothetical protein